jgi:hypothetical protein
MWKTWSAETRYVCTHWDGPSADKDINQPGKLLDKEGIVVIAQNTQPTVMQTGCKPLNRVPATDMVVRGIWVVKANRRRTPVRG